MNRSLQFANSSVLLLLWLVPAIIWLWIWLRKRSENKLKEFISGPMQEKLRFPISQYRLISQMILVSLGLTLLIISVAGPFAGFKEQTVTSNNHDIIMLLDVSSSMTARDVQPDRLGSAKSAIIEISAKLPRERIAMLAFRHGLAILCPLTYDREFLQQTVKLISTTSAPAGETDIGSAIITAVEMFNKNSTAKRFIIIFSDGEDLAGNIEKAISTATENSVTILTIGIGKSEGTTIPDPLRKGKPYIYNGGPVTTKLNDQVLKRIATATNGEYIHSYDNNISPADICTEYLRNIKASEQTESAKKLRIYRYNWFLLPAFILLLSAIALGIKKSNRKRNITSAKLTLLLTSIILTTLSNGYSEELSATDRTFNTAATLFASSNYAETITALDSIRTDNTEIRSRINMAYGCTYFRKAVQLDNALEQIKLYKKAAESFQSLLKQEADNQTATHNLAVSYREMQIATVKLAASQSAEKVPGKPAEPVEAEKNNGESSEEAQQKTDKPSATDSAEQNNKLSDKEIEDILSTILSREKEYQTKKQQYGKLTPLQSDVRDW